MMSEPVSCNLCGKEWPRDPVLEVPCPVARCRAEVGQHCRASRPSGHAHSAAFAGLPPWGHDERELAADAAGAYGTCPYGRCGKAPGWHTGEAGPRQAEQIGLF